MDFIISVREHVKALLASWSEGLKLIFVPSNLALFAKGTANLILRTYKAIWANKASFIIGAMITAVIGGFVMVVPVIIFTDPFAALLGVMLAPIVWWAIAEFLIILLMRPSIVRKDVNYISKYSLRFFIYFSIAACWWAFVVIPTPFASITIKQFLALVGHLIFVPLQGHLLRVSVGPFFPLFIFFILFYLDSSSYFSGIFRSAWNSLKMIYYNYPLLALIYGLQFAVLCGVQELLNYAAKLGKLPFYMQIILVIVDLVMPLILFLILIAPLVFVYTKRVNEQMKLYV